MCLFFILYGAGHLSLVAYVNAERRACTEAFVTAFVIMQQVSNTFLIQNSVRKSTQDCSRLDIFSSKRDDFAVFADFCRFSQVSEVTVLPEVFSEVNTRWKFYMFSLLLLFIQAKLSSTRLWKKFCAFFAV
jgi:hypothetical protein